MCVLEYFRCEDNVCFVLNVASQIEQLNKSSTWANLLRRKRFKFEENNC